MGQHYVPRRYLRNFAIPGSENLVWTFDKVGAEPRSLPMAVVAQTRGYYDPDVERFLGTKVEPAGSDAIEKLLTRVPTSLTSEERLGLTIHIAVMLKRVPHHRKKSWGLLPGVAEEIRPSLRHDVSELLRGNGATAEDIERTLDLGDELLQNYVKNPPPDVLEQIRTPMSTPSMLFAIQGMTWRILIPPKGCFFITSDNPAVFHECYGLGTEKAEILLPLAPHRALHGSYQEGPSNLVFQN